MGHLNRNSILADVCPVVERSEHSIKSVSAPSLSFTGYSPSAHPPSSVQPDLSSPAQIHETGPQEHHASPVLEVRRGKNPSKFGGVFLSGLFSLPIGAICLIC